jgi:hypothetical protein
MGDRFDRVAASFASVLPIRVIAAAEVVAGAYGIVALVDQVGRLVAAQPNRRVAVFTLFTLLLLLNLLCVTAGMMLWRGARHGALLSAAVQWAQLLQVYSPAVTYVFVVGGALSFYIAWPRVGYLISYGNQSHITLNSSEDTPVACAINLVAAAILMVLVRHQNQLDETAESAGPSV